MLFTSGLHQRSFSGERLVRFFLLMLLLISTSLFHLATKSPPYSKLCGRVFITPYSFSSSLVSSTIGVPLIPYLFFSFLFFLSDQEL